MDQQGRQERTEIVEAMWALCDGALTPAVSPDDAPGTIGWCWARIMGLIRSAVPIYEFFYWPELEQYYEGHSRQPRRIGVIRDELAQMPPFKRFVGAGYDGMGGVNYAELVGYLYGCGEPEARGSMRAVLGLDTLGYPVWTPIFGRVEWPIGKRFPGHAGREREVKELRERFAELGHDD
jgi:hypothetical protein